MTTKSSVIDSESTQVFVSEPGESHSDAGFEEQFYSFYNWALDPVLSVGDIFKHLRDSLNLLNSLNVPWQVEECKVNLYLLACALTCTVDDYLAKTPPDLSKISRRLPSLRIPVLSAQKL